MMNPKLPIRWYQFVLTLLSALILSGCTLTSGDVVGSKVMFVPDPQAGRDVALNYIRDHYDVDPPFGAESWSDRNITPADVTTSSAFEYIAGDWYVVIIYRIVDPVERVYRTTVTNQVNFTWEGEVNASGGVSETSVSFSQIPGEPIPTPDVGDFPFNTPTATLSPVITTNTYRDPQYRLEMKYLSSWSLDLLSAGRNTGTGFGTKSLVFSKGEDKLVIQYKNPWEITQFEGTPPEGVIEIRKQMNLLGFEFPVKYIVVDGLDIYLFFSGILDDLEFQIYLETTASEIPLDVQDEAENMIASIVRTGEPLPSPTPPPTPLPTSKYDATKSGTGSGSTVTEDCNKANFVSHVTVPEGAVLPPGVKFTKTWRIQNVGTCTWTTAYKLVFSTGDRMGADKSIPLPGSVSPGATVDISIDLTSPEKEGSYAGYWILNDAQGYWFGLGEQKRGFIPVEINVVIPDTDYAYDFGINYCDAKWINSEDQELPCPGAPNSSRGFVILVANPDLENRTEDELALWVHPYEERYGWIQGTYPKFKVKTGDHFLVWVGCMADSEKCSIQFYLKYKDEDGDVHNLGSWYEAYDGVITKIDLDLSELDGQTVRFILRTEVLTQNVTAAQGFWFVPRIERP